MCSRMMASARSGTTSQTTCSMISRESLAMASYSGPLALMAASFCSMEWLRADCEGWRAAGRRATASARAHAAGPPRAAGLASASRGRGGGAGGVNGTAAAAAATARTARAARVQRRASAPHQARPRARRPASERRPREGRSSCALRPAGPPDAAEPGRLRQAPAGASARSPARPAGATPGRIPGISDGRMPGGPSGVVGSGGVGERGTGAGIGAAAAGGVATGGGVACPPLPSMLISPYSASSIAAAGIEDAVVRRTGAARPDPGWRPVAETPPCPKASSTARPRRTWSPAPRRRAAGWKTGCTPAPLANRGRTGPVRTGRTQCDLASRRRR